MSKISLLDQSKEVKIILPNGDKLKTIFRSIVPKENPNTRTVIARFLPLFDIKKSDLFINQNINLEIYLKSKKQIKTITKDAILIKNGNTVVYVIEDNIAKLHMLTYPSSLDYDQEQICELISLLVEVHDYMDNQKEDNTMPLFNDLEDNIEEIEVENSLNEETLSISSTSELISVDERRINFLLLTLDFTCNISFSYI